MVARRFFGTDGIRGRANEEPLVADTIARIARATARVVLPAGEGTLVAGHDGRASAAGILDAWLPPFLEVGTEAVEVGLVTTPGLAHLVRRRGFSLGVMVSASHNPPGDNGIKLFGPGGEKLPDRVEEEIERVVEAGAAAARTGGNGTRRRDASPCHEIIEHLAQETAPGLSLRGVRLVVDCANGGASRIAPAVFARLAAEVVPFADVPDGTNINVGCGALHPSAVADEVRRRGANLGLALDGDGDRAVFVDEQAQVVPGEAILLGLARDALERGILPARTLVTTVMSSTALRRALAALGGRLEVVPVGDRAVVEAMRRGRLGLGGEPSGHVVFDGTGAYTGDGVFTALRVLECLRRRGERLSSWREGFHPFPQSLLSVPVASKPPLESLAPLGEEIARAERQLGPDGRVLVRYSGTEPVVRVFVEGSDAEAVAESAGRISRLLERTIGRPGP
ncbi:MAG TPA: phosphoglucosamine mutase [Planctomycetota bacterium]|jgi:phosphoglucosamine mutase|nr:phosphoglucosamine mutase [Planctomycetota bacterium]